MTNTRCECLKKWWAVNHVHGCNDSTCECQVNGLNANDAEKWPPDTQCRGSSRCDGVPTGEAGVPKKGVPLKSSCVIVQQIKYDYRTAGHLLCDYCYWHGAGYWLGERFGSGDGERETLLTRQIAFEPLPASVYCSPLVVRLVRSCRGQYPGLWDGAAQKSASVDSSTRIMCGHSLALHNTCCKCRGCESSTRTW